MMALNPLLKKLVARTAATPTPRQRVAAMIDDLVAKGREGEHILQQIERQTVGFSSKQQRLGFFWSKFTEDEMNEAA